MHRRSLLVAVLALALAGAAAGCGGGGGGGGGDENAPSLNTLASQTLTASQDQNSAHYELDASATINAKGDVEPGAEQFVNKPLSFRLEGDASPDALTADGSVEAGDRNFSASVRADSDELYLMLLGTWYGTKQFGLDQLQQQGEASAAEQREVLDRVRRQADQVLDGDVTDGPTTDGVDTWKFQGTLDPDGLERLAEDQGETVTDEERQQIQTVADDLTVTTLVGKSDHLLRHLEIDLDISGDDIKALAEDDEDADRLESVKANLTLDLSDWGKQFSITPPSSYQPLESLAGALGGLFGGSS